VTFAVKIIRQVAWVSFCVVAGSILATVLRWLMNVAAYGWPS
jgi:hypothetical protein